VETETEAPALETEAKTEAVYLETETEAPGLETEAKTEAVYLETEAEVQGNWSISVVLNLFWPVAPCRAQHPPVAYKPFDKNNVSSSSRVWGRAPAANDFWTFYVQF